MPADDERRYAVGRLGTSTYPDRGPCRVTTGESSEPSPGHDGRHGLLQVPVQLDSGRASRSMPGCISGARQAQPARQKPTPPAAPAPGGGYGYSVSVSPLDDIGPAAKSARVQTRSLGPGLGRTFLRCIYSRRAQWTIQRGCVGRRRARVNEAQAMCRGCKRTKVKNARRRPMGFPDGSRREPY